MQLQIWQAHLWLHPNGKEERANHHTAANAEQPGGDAGEQRCLREASQGRAIPLHIEREVFESRLPNQSRTAATSQGPLAPSWRCSIGAISTVMEVLNRGH